MTSDHHLQIPKQKHPLVSIMMCAYNASPYIHEAIESILSQSYAHFEFIIIDDGSTDQTVEIIRSYKDPRVKLFQCRHDYIHSLNIGLRRCKGDYIARIDADDKASPNRIETQVKLMMKNANISACFSWATSFGIFEETIGCRVKGQLENPLLLLLSHNFLIHSTAMVRRDYLEQHKIRYKRYPYAEDYKMWADIASTGGLIYVIPQSLVQYRISQQQVSYKFYSEQRETTLYIQQEIIEALLPKMPQDIKRPLRNAFNSMLALNTLELVQGEEIVILIYRILQRIHRKHHSIHNLFNH